MIYIYTKKFPNIIFLIEKTTYKIFKIGYNPKHLGALLKYGTLISEVNGNIERAIAYFNQALQIDPDNFVANFRLGQIYLEKQKNFQIALTYFKRIVEIRDKYWPGYFFLYLCYKELLDWLKCEQSLQSVLLLEPEFLKGWKHLGLLYMEISEYKKALRVWQKANQIFYQQKDEDILNSIADCQYQLEEYDEAIFSYK